MAIHPSEPGFESAAPPGQPQPAAVSAASDALAPPSPDPQATMRAQLEALQQRGRNGANWFFWVAGLSLVNSVVLLSGGSSYFVIGMGVTLLVDAMTATIAQNSPDISTVLKAVAFGFDVVVASIVVGFGWFARKRHMIVYALGMLLYTLDGLLFVLFEDWMSVGFHAFALWCMWSGFSAFRGLNAQLRALASDAE